MTIELSSKKELDAIYFGLVLSGYEYATINKPNNIAEITQKIMNYKALGEVRDFFAMARVKTCEVYPFWPRAALLESALFFMEDGNLDICKYQLYVNGLANIDIQERNDSFFSWVKGLPKHLKTIMKDHLFNEVHSQLSAIVSKMDVLNDITKLERKLSYMQLEEPINKLSVLICPIKCCYSADYFAGCDEMFVMLGDFLAHSIVHEYMHLLVHPIVVNHKARILSDSQDKQLSIDASYYLQDDDGFLNAYEEYIVRTASELIATDQEIDLEYLVLQG